MNKRLILSPFFLLLVLLAGYEFYTSVRGRELMTAAHLVEGLSLATPIKMQVTEFYFMQGDFPNSNAELGLPSPAALRGRSVKSIEVSTGGKITVTYNNALKKDGSIMLMPTIPSGYSSQNIEWLCTTETIEQSLFENISVPCYYMRPGMLSELMEAIAAADEVKVQGLVNRGVDVNGVWHSETPLQSAITRDRYAIAQQLIAAGANVNHASLAYQGITPLMHAAIMGKKNMVVALLDNGAEIDAVDSAGKTALMHAAEKGQKEIIELLLSRNANPLLLDKRGRDAVRYAKTYGRRTGNDKLIESAKSTFSAAAASSGQAGNSNELMRASRQGNTEKVRQLLRENASIEAVDGYNASALHYALEARQNAVIEVLLESGANVNSADHDGKTPLLLAVKNGDNKIVDVLIRAGANVNAVDRYNNTAFLLAIRFGYKDIVARLLEAGVSETMNVALQASFSSPAQKQAINDVQELILLSPLVLKRDEEDLATLLLEAIKVRQISVITFLLKHDVSLVLNVDGLPLHLASRKGANDIVRLLIEAGANVDAISPEGKTALMLAVEIGNIHLVKLLLDAGANADIRDINGLTAIRMAKANYSEDIVALLRQYKN